MANWIGQAIGDVFVGALVTVMVVAFFVGLGVGFILGWTFS